MQLASFVWMASIIYRRAWRLLDKEMKYVMFMSKRVFGEVSQVILSPLDLAAA